MLRKTQSNLNNPSNPTISKLPILTRTKFNFGDPISGDKSLLDYGKSRDNVTSPSGFKFDTDSVFSLGGIKPVGTEENTLETVKTKGKRRKFAADSDTISVGKDIPFKSPKVINKKEEVGTKLGTKFGTEMKSDFNGKRKIGIEGKISNLDGNKSEFREKQQKKTEFGTEKGKNDIKNDIKSGIKCGIKNSIKNDIENDIKKAFKNDIRNLIKTAIEIDNIAIESRQKELLRKIAESEKLIKMINMKKPKTFLTDSKIAKNKAKRLRKNVSRQIMDELMENDLEIRKTFKRRYGLEKVEGYFYSSNVYVSLSTEKEVEKVGTAKTGKGFRYKDKVVNFGTFLKSFFVKETFLAKKNKENLLILNIRYHIEEKNEKKDLLKNKFKESIFFFYPLKRSTLTLKQSNLKVKSIGRQLRISKKRLIEILEKFNEKTFNKEESLLKIIVPVLFSGKKNERNLTTELKKDIMIEVVNLIRNFVLNPIKFDISVIEINPEKQQKLQNDLFKAINWSYKEKAVIQNNNRRKRTKITTNLFNSIQTDLFNSLPKLNKKQKTPNCYKTALKNKTITKSTIPSFQNLTKTFQNSIKIQSSKCFEEYRNKLLNEEKFRFGLFNAFSLNILKGFDPKKVRKDDKSVQLLVQFLAKKEKKRYLYIENKQICSNFRIFLTGKEKEISRKISKGNNQFAVVSEVLSNLMDSFNLPRGRKNGRMHLNYMLNWVKEVFRGIKKHSRLDGEFLEKKSRECDEKLLKALSKTNSQFIHSSIRSFRKSDETTELASTLAKYGMSISFAYELERKEEQQIQKRIMDIESLSKKEKSFFRDLKLLSCFFEFSELFLEVVRDLISIIDIDIFDDENDISEILSFKEFSDSWRKRISRLFVASSGMDQLLNLNC